MKLQPNFSWQKYEGNSEDQKQQFQYQLQNQHIQVANSVNSTIDDLSFFTRERATSWAWIDNRQIWKKTFTGTITGTSTNATAHGITGIRTVTRLYGTAQDAVPMTVNAIMLDHADNTLANTLWIEVTPTQYLIHATNNTWNGYIYNLTIEYTKG